LTVPRQGIVSAAQVFLIAQTEQSDCCFPNREADGAKFDEQSNKLLDAFIKDEAQST